MKKIICSVLCVLIMVSCLSGCGTSTVDTPFNHQSEQTQTDNTTQTTHIHTWTDATCTSPMICTCGQTVGIELGHQFSTATCTRPEICERCGTTRNPELGHDYAEANCVSPKLCNRCEQTEGNALGHDYVDNKCTRCEKIDPDSLPVELSKLYLIDSGFYEFKSGAFTDSFGNSYTGVHYYTSLYQSGNGKAPHSEYNLGGKYKKFSGSMVASAKTNPDWTYYINIYVDGVLKFTKTGFSKTSGKVDFEIAVNGGEVLRIEAGNEGNMGDFDMEVGIVNALLSK